MKKTLLFLLLFLGLGLTSYATSVKPVYRNVEDNANGKFRWTCWETEGYYMINCFASELCKVCPSSTTNLDCGGMGQYDGTDYVAMEDLFTYCDNQIANNVSSGTHSMTYQVAGEPSVRVYRVTWSFNNITNNHEQIWTRIQ